MVDKAKYIKRLFVIFVIYFFCGKLGVDYGAMGGSSLSMIWIPSGISLAAFVRYGTSIWPAIWLGGFAINTLFLIDHPSNPSILKGVIFSSCTATINVLIQGFFIHALFKRFVPEDNVFTTPGLLNFLTKVTLLPSAFNTLFIIILFGWGGYLQKHAFLDFVSVWVTGSMADYQGYFVVGLFCITWFSKRKLIQNPTTNLRAPLFVSIALSILVCASVFWHYSTIHLVAMIGVLVAMYWGLRATTAFMLGVSLALTLATAKQLGPFALEDQLSSMTALLMFVFGLGAPIYLLAANRYELLLAKEELEDKVIERTKELKKANRRLKRLSNSDGLTGLANRRHLDERLEEEWRRAAREKNHLTIGMIDVDWFKKYNDYYGHAAGDECLRAVARLLSTNVLRAGDLIARYGGEEFVFIAPGVNGENALDIAQKICESVQNEKIPHYASPTKFVTVSIGVASTIPDLTQSPASLLETADSALYQAKARGRNTCVLGTEIISPIEIR